MATPWISTEDIKARMASLDPRGLHISDPIKDELAGRACDWVERECAIRVVHDPLLPFRYRFNGNGRIRLHLPWLPVRALTELVVNQSAISFGSSSAFSAGQVQAYHDSRSVYFPPGFCRGLVNVLVGWEAGYDLADVPGELKSLAEAVAILMWKERDRWGDQTKNLPGQTVAFIRELPPQERATLAGYKDFRRYSEGFGGVPA